ncbi:MAG TPA: hypothetical protein VFJ58_12370 [Armatimonadota bacterium]|nr:hypothetical protein [Armatimonadota bacterium]
MRTPQVSVAPGLERAAHQLAEANGNADPAVSVVYWVPAPDEIRLVVVDSTVAPEPAGERLAPFYFGADPVGGIDYRSAIILISPEDDQHAPLPPEWGSWNAARPIWRRS